MNNASILTVLVISLFSCGQKADVYTLHSQDITLTVTNYGARVMSLRTPNKNGALENIVVGHKTVEEYMHPVGERFLGARMVRLAPSTERWNSCAMVSHIVVRSSVLISFTLVSG